MPRHIFLDVEQHYAKGVSLKSLTLRQCLVAAPILGMSCAEEDEDPVWFAADAEGWPELLAYLRAAALDEDAIFIAHKAAYDIRALRFGWTRAGGPLAIPQPHRVRCSLELACGAWPNQPGGYGLESLSRTLNLGMAKLGKGSAVSRMSPDELAAYCIQDTRMARAIHNLAIPHLHPDEIELAEAANRVRELWFDVSAEKVDAALSEFSAFAADEVKAALETLGPDGELAFGWDGGGRVKSVKPAQLRDILLNNLGFDTVSTSKKKINPEKLRENAQAAKAVTHVANANKAMHTVRKTKVFAGAQVADAELGWFRAHTGRYSSPSVGRGLNLHNLGKRNKRMAKITRSMFSICEPYCLVRADFANVEYRVGGLLYNSRHIIDLFTKDPLADPYSSFWHSATGKWVTKADPARQVAKQAVLQLEYLAGLENWTNVLLMALSDPDFGVTLEQLDALCKEQGWLMPSTPAAKRTMTRTRAPWQVVSVAHHARELFHAIHPEFRAKTKWLEQTIHAASRAMDADTGNRIIDGCYTYANALDRNMVDLTWDGRFEGASVRVRCGHWPAPTVTWRDLGLRSIGDGDQIGMTMMSGKRGYWPLRSTVIIENIAQSAARNAICQAKLELGKRGYPYLPSVHDELMLVVPRTREWVLKARQDLLDVVGPNKLPGWGWAAMVNPDEITVTRSLWEVEPGQLLAPVDEKNGKPVYPKNDVWWDRLRAGEETLLENLP